MADKKKKPAKKRPGVSKATKARIELRVNEILSIRLDGAEIWDVREYVREKEQEDGSPWKLTRAAKPLSDATLWRYIARADELIAESCRASRKKRIRRHIAQRRNLYAKAIAQGDLRAAGAVLKDLAELEGLYPRKSVSVTGAGGGPLVLQIVEEVVGKDSSPVPADANAGEARR